MTTSLKLYIYMLLGKKSRIIFTVHISQTIHVRITPPLVTNNKSKECGTEMKEENVYLLKLFNKYTNHSLSIKKSSYKHFHLDFSILVSKRDHDAYQTSMIDRQHHRQYNEHHNKNTFHVLPKIQIKVSLGKN